MQCSSAVKLALLLVSSSDPAGDIWPLVSYQEDQEICLSTEDQFRNDHSSIG